MGCWGLPASALPSFGLGRNEVRGAGVVLCGGVCARGSAAAGRGGGHTVRAGSRPKRVEGGLFRRALRLSAYFLSFSAFKRAESRLLNRKAGPGRTERGVGGEVGAVRGGGHTVRAGSGPKRVEGGLFRRALGLSAYFLSFSAFKRAESRVLHRKSGFLEANGLIRPASSRQIPMTSPDPHDEPRSP